VNVGIIIGHIASEKSIFRRISRLFEETCTEGGETVSVKAGFIGSICPKDWLFVVSPRVRVFDDEKKSVIQLFDFWLFPGCWWLFGLLVLVPKALLGPERAQKMSNAKG
jgi:hypothetical protein